MLTTIPWSEKFSVGSDRVDRQHRELLDHANRLFSAVTVNDPGQHVDELMGFLQKHVALHFLSEERVMHRLGFPEVEAHRTMHWRIIEELIEIEKALAREGCSAAVVERLTGKVGPWLVDHFTGPDLRLAAFLATQQEPADQDWS